jgi:glutaredoxin
MITIYSKDNCPHCDAAVNLCEANSLTYRVFKLGKDFTKEDLVTLVPNARSVPQIFEGTEYVGDFTKFKQKFVDSTYTLS